MAEENGYFVTEHWWENPSTCALFSTAGPDAAPLSPVEVLANAVQALTGRMHGSFAKGTAAYDAWKAALLDDGAFPPNAVLPLLVERMMCHGDAMDCLSDGRHHAALYLRGLAAGHPGAAPLLEAAAAEFDALVRILWEEMVPVLGGWERGEAQMRRLALPQTRQLFAGLIDRMKEHDEQALALLRRAAL